MSEHNKRCPEIYSEPNYEFDGRELETTVEIEGDHYEVVYNQYGNQFEVLSAKLFRTEFPDESPYFTDTQELYNCIEETLQYEFEINFDYGL